MNLLLAALLLMQDKTAEETFKKLTEILEKANSITVRRSTKGDSVAPNSKPNSEILLLLKEGNKVRFEARFPNMPKEEAGETVMWLVSDGKRMMYRFGPTDSPQVKDTPPNLRAKLIEVLTYTDLSIGSYFTFLQATTRSVNPEPSDIVEVTKLAHGAEDGTVRTLTCRMIVAKKDFADIRLWYDPKTWKPIKRTTTLLPPGHSTLIETYDEFTIDADIPDEKFKLPEEKK